MIHLTSNSSVASRTFPKQRANPGFGSNSRNGKPKVFIPITDEILFEHPELITSPLMPYQIDHPCYHWLSVEVEEVEPCKDAA